MMQQVSLQAFETVKTHLRGSYLRILKALYENQYPMSNNDLAEYLKTKPNYVSGRTGEMVKLKLITILPRKKMNHNGLYERLFYINWEDNKIRRLFRC